MISKERLQELINEGATIWYYEYEPFIAGYSSIIHICSVNLSSDCSIKDNTLYDAQASFEDHNYDVLIGKLTDLFETRKEAEWQLKYHATRIEELNLPTWEEFIKEDNTVISFWKNGHKITLYKYIKNKRTNNITIMVLDDMADCACWKFKKPATEENYIKACDLCLKLFKGEEE